jgi:hypothetical protein
VSAAITEALARYLDIDVAADNWDEPPSLALIIENPEGIVDFAPVPITGEMWAKAEPWRVVVAAGKAAVAMREGFNATPLSEGDTFTGIVLFTEGWGLSEATTDKAQDLTRWLRAGGRIENHPDRTEYKLVNALLTDGSLIMLTHARGGKTVSDPAYQAVEGRIPDALRSALIDFQEATA